ncbi:MAG: hypothetical protein HONBIEJF_00074 [Fimbriimonadaceae bacterium]|nr:hypothetical protein [Fimbriimonadaceae bacterium]
MALRASWCGTLLILPLLAIAWSGNHDPGASTPVTPVQAYSATDEQALLAYQEPLRAVRRLALCKPTTGYEGSSIQYTSETYRVASQWVTGHRNGQLKEIPPNDYTDASNVGVKDHVLNAKRLMGDALVRLAIDWTRRGNADTAAEAAMLAIEVGQVNKYADFPSMMSTFGSQYRAAKQLSEIATKLSPAYKAKLRKRLNALQFKPVSDLLERSEILYAQFSADLPTRISRNDISLINTAKSIVDGGRPSYSRIEKIRDLVRDCNGDVPILICAARIGWERETMMKDVIAEIQSRLVK